MTNRNKTMYIRYYSLLGSQKFFQSNKKYAMQGMKMDTQVPTAVASVPFLAFLCPLRCSATVSSQSGAVSCMPSVLILTNTFNFQMYLYTLVYNMAFMDLYNNSRITVTLLFPCSGN